jgi:hypothetical protein
MQQGGRGINQMQRANRGRLTLMLILVCTAALSFKFGADLLEQLDQTGIWRSRRTGYATMRVVHGELG